MEQVFEMEEYAPATLDEALFEPPSEIQALLEGGN